MAFWIGDCRILLFQGFYRGAGSARMEGAMQNFDDTGGALWERADRTIEGAIYSNRQSAGEFNFLLPRLNEGNGTGFA
ncbi:hypothetical protein OAL00_00880 [Verrucomicrobiales bacterium]|nr:hypothetical protein [Verrucomicrobiales bacterium]